jgi:glycopeptide antibiotics resistance protein
VWGFSFSLLVEIIQLFSKVGSFDVDDILLNTAGAVCGYVLFLVLYVWHRRNKGKSVNT